MSQESSMIKHGLLKTESKMSLAMRTSIYNPPPAKNITKSIRQTFLPVITGAVTGVQLPICSGNAPNNSPWTISGYHGTDISGRDSDPPPLFSLSLSLSPSLSLSFISFSLYISISSVPVLACISLCLCIPPCVCRSRWLLPSRLPKWRGGRLSSIVSTKSTAYVYGVWQPQSLCFCCNSMKRK